MAIITNPELKWDGETEVRAGRHIERPSGWRVTVEDINGQPPPWIHHKPDGFNLDANHIRAKITYAQDVTIPAGEHYVIVHNVSHLTWGNDDYTVAWRIELALPDKMLHSKDLWCAREKGDQSFAVCVKTPQDTPAELRVVFWTKWADTNGSVNLRKIDVQPQAWGLPVRDTLTAGKRVADSPGVTVIEDDDQPPIDIPLADTAPGKLADVMNTLSDSMTECARLMRAQPDSDTLAACLRKLARGFNDAADLLEQ